MSCSALGDRASRCSGEDIRIRRLSAVHVLQRRLRDLLHQFRGVFDPLPSLKLRVTFGYRCAKRSDPLLLGLHAPDGVADHLGGVAVKATADFGLDVSSPSLEKG